MSLSQITTNYNTLGKVGPHYERPEYRPPEKDENQETGLSSQQKGDRSTLSVRNPAGLKASSPAPPPAGKLNLSAAAGLVDATSALIRNLPPLSTRTPHLNVPKNLMRPVYV